MPYIGNTIRAADDYRLIDDISSGFDGNDTTFALQVAGSAPVPFPKSPQQVLISVNGVIQEPDPTGASGFNLVGTNIVFSSAPTNGQAFFGIIYATADYLNAGGTFPAGALGAPSITFTSDEDTGFYRKGSGDIGIVSNATEVANFDGDGLTIADSIIHSGDTNTKIRFPAADTVTVETNGSEKLRVDSSGKVGIGTASPQRLLHQHVSSSGANYHSFTNDTTGSGSSDGLLLGINLNEEAIFWNYENTDMRFATNGTDRLIIDNSGRVGIGTTSPEQLLHVQGTNNGDILSLLRLTNAGGSANTEARIEFELGTFFTGYIGQTHDSGDAGSLVFGNKSSAGAAPTEKMRINKSGNMAIGITSPAARLHIYGNGHYVTTDSGKATNGIHVRGSQGNSGEFGGAISFSCGDANSSSAIAAVQNSNDSDVTGLSFFTHSSSDGSADAEERMRIDSSGKVGIGTSSPSAKLEIFNSTTGDVTLLRLRSTPGVGDTQYLGFDGSSNSSRARIGSEITGGGHGNLVFETRDSTTANLTERMRIDSSGNVGIGTTSPSAKLKINGSSAYTVANSGQSVEGLDIQATAGGSGNFGGAISLGASGSGRSAIAALQDGADADRTGLVFITHDSNTASANSEEKMRIDSAGNVGIGTTVLNRSSTSRTLVQLDYDGSDASEGVEIRLSNSALNGNAATDNAAITYVGQDLGITNRENGTIRFRNNGDERMRIDSAGNVGIGVSAMDARLHVVNAHNLLNMVVATSNTFTGNASLVSFRSVSSEGGFISLTNNGTTCAYGTTSDYRLKENATTISDGITRLKTLKPYRFNFKAVPDTTVDGFFAHEVTAVPEAVIGEKDGEQMQGLDYAKLTPLLTAALQEAITKIETLEIKVAALEAA